MCNIKERTEKWKEITGYEGKYWVSNFGCVKNHKDKPVGHLGYSDKIDNNKRPRLKLGGNSVYFVENLVFCAFRQQIPYFQEVLHLDKNIKNNYVNNLIVKEDLSKEKWVALNNYKESYWISDTGRIFGLDGEKNIFIDKRNGRAKVQLFNKRMGKTYFLDILVCEHFLQGYSESCHIIHKDKNLKNNTIDNLDFYLNEDEIWKKIIIDGISYKLSNYGFIKNEHNSYLSTTERDSRNHLTFGDNTTAYIDELVYLNFCGPMQFGQRIIHKNGNLLDDSIDNLTLTELNDKEIWKDVVGYEGLYEISNIGNVRNFRGKLKVKRCNDATLGRERVDLSKNNIPEEWLVHRLVGIAFIPNPDNKPEINHIDGNPANNNVGNLEWATHKENMEHASRTGLVSRGEDHTTKLKNKDVFVIRELAKEGIPQIEIAKFFNMSPMGISSIINRKRWKHI